jgi:hypothetical protein
LCADKNIANDNTAGASRSEVSHIAIDDKVNNVSQVKAIGPDNSAIIGIFSVGINPVGIAFDGANIWVANRNSHTVTKLKASDGSKLGEFPVNNEPIGVAFDGSNIWVTNFGSNNVTKLWAEDGQNLGLFSTGKNPWGVVFDGLNIWVSNQTDGTISKR